jgi:hypothetical protein
VSTRTFKVVRIVAFFGLMLVGLALGYAEGRVLASIENFYFPYPCRADLPPADFAKPPP